MLIPRLRTDGIVTEPQVPTINIQETCRAAAGVMVNLMGGSTSQKDVEICLETENKARQQMAQGLVDVSGVRPGGLHPAQCLSAELYRVAHLLRDEQVGARSETIAGAGNDRSYQPGRA
jgi:hypothetical protein